MNKKDLVIVALATFCLTSTLFMILPSRSAERDPWADTSGPTVGEPDGRINMRDIQYEIMHFNEDVSNMTRNVNVTNFPITIQTMPATNSGRYVWVNPHPGDGSYHLMPVIETKGYKKIYFRLTGNCNFTSGWRIQGAFNTSNHDWHGQIDHFEEIEVYHPLIRWREFDIKGENLVIWLGDTIDNSYEMSWYMTA